MKCLATSVLPWVRLLGLVPCCLCLEVAAAVETHSNAFRLQHDGLLRSTKSAASMRGIGKTHISHTDFELSVDGQFQMIGSARLVREPGNGQEKRFQTEPVCVNIVAIGKVLLKFPGTGETFSAGIAVYRVSERSWILDGVTVKLGTTR